MKCAIPAPNPPAWYELWIARTTALALSLSGRIEASGGS
jgi:hypothetical protein